MSRGHRRTMVIATVVAIGAAACGSSSKAASNATPAPTTALSSTATSAAGATGATDIVVGGLVSASIFPGSDDGVTARFARANKEGGVNGSKIRFIGNLDDGADPTRGLSLTQQLIQKDKVMALVPVISAGFSSAASDFAIQAKVPFVGWGFEPGFCGNDYGFGFDGCDAGTSVPTAQLAAIAKAINKDPKDIRYAVLGGDNTTGQNGVNFQKKIAVSLGAKMAYAESTYPVSQATVDNTPYVQALLAAKPDVITLYTNFAHDTGMVAALHAGGYKGIIVSPTTYIPGILDSQPAVAAAIEDSWTTSPVPPGEGNSEEVKQITADLAAIGKPAFLTLGAQVGWVSADLFIQMLTASKATTGENLVTAVNKGFTYKPLDGGIGPIKFPDGHTLTEGCESVIHIINKKYQQVLPETCFPVLAG